MESRPYRGGRVREGIVVASPQGQSSGSVTSYEAPWSGAVAAGTGIASYAYIPIPGGSGLVLKVQPPRDWRGSTSSVFVQNIGDPRYGKPYLRLDYGFNKSTGAIDYHWNIVGKAARIAFPDIKNHMPVGTGGAALHWGARAFRAGGRFFIVTGVAIDAYSFFIADKPFRRGLQIVSAWTGAGILSARLGRVGAAVGTFIEPGFGTAVGGGIGVIAGGFIGYLSADAGAGYIYDWAENTIFTPVPEVPVPAMPDTPQ